MISFVYTKSERLETNRVLNYHNQVLLNKLVEISQGKQLGVVREPSRQGKATVTNEQSVKSLVAVSEISSLTSRRERSLNIGLRKRENDRIEQENIKLA